MIENEGGSLIKKAVYVIVDKKGKLVLQGGLSAQKGDAENCLVKDDGESIKKAIVIEA